MTYQNNNKEDPSYPYPYPYSYQNAKNYGINIPASLPQNMKDYYYRHYFLPKMREIEKNNNNKHNKDKKTFNQLMNTLPEDVLYIISGYYGSQLPSNLSRDIKDYALLLDIKQQEYYNETTKTWNIGSVLNKLKNPQYFNVQKQNIMAKKFYRVEDNVWSKWNNQVNKLWFLHSPEERRKIYDSDYTENQIGV